MRTGKYRGLAVNMAEPTWLNGSLVVCDDGTCIIANYFAREWGAYREVHPETVGEFAGRTDSKGNEIYEHDFIHLADNYYKMVVFDTRECAFCLQTVGSEISSGSLGRYLYEFPQAVVIGNLWNNPELNDPRTKGSTMNIDLKRLTVSQQWKRNLSGFVTLHIQHDDDPVLRDIRLSDAQLRKLVAYAMDKGYPTLYDIPDSEAVQLLNIKIDIR
ncbi:MAG: hypothetical protein IKP45_03090 [Bacteroidales bacterium]|nr:hypothetical protein [Bacteroidales bacterium]